MFRLISPWHDKFDMKAIEKSIREALEERGPEYAKHVAEQAQIYYSKQFPMKTIQIVEVKG